MEKVKLLLALGADNSLRAKEDKLISDKVKKLLKDTK